ncbi:PERF protein, partial [Alaudala cheleensis]|nr:PERF protein [Alaudala cheleensis]
GDTGDPRGDTGVPRCLLCPDALRSMSPRRVPPGVGGWRSGRRCRRQVRAAAGAGAVGSAVTSAVTRGWRLGVSWGRGPKGAGLGAGGAGSRSRLAQEGLRWMRQDQSALTWLQVTCVFYWTWLDPLSARPSPHFLRAVRSLPARFTPATAAEFEPVLT